MHLSAASEEGPCPLLCFMGEQRDTTLNWYWSTGFTNPKPYKGHVSSSESRIAFLIRARIYVSVPWVALHKHFQTHPLSSLRLRKAHVKETVSIKWCLFCWNPWDLTAAERHVVSVALESLGVQPWREDLHPWKPLFSPFPIQWNWSPFPRPHGVIRR